MAVPLLLLVIALAVQQFAGQRRALLDELAGKAHAERIALEPVIGAAVRHVSGLREFAEDRLTGRLPQPEAPLRQMLAPAPACQWHDGIHPRPLGRPPTADARLGNILGDPSLLDRSPAGLSELDQALDMFAPMRMAHIAAPQLRWSYYFSAQGDFLTMFPFAPSTDFVALGQLSEHARAHRRLARLRRVRRRHAGTRPEPQPLLDPGVYRDAGGAGPMVSHAAPVYAGDRFMGVVGTDILLGYLDGFLRSDRLAGRARLDRERPGPGAGVVERRSGDRPGHYGTRRTPGSTGGKCPWPTARRSGRLSRDCRPSVLAERLAEAPFSLLYVVSGRDLPA